MYMTVDEFINMCIDADSQEFTIYDSDKEKNVFTGYLDDCPDDYRYSANVDSFDTLYGDNGLTLNVFFDD